MTAFLLDMDGVLFHGERVLDGAPEFVARLAAHPHLFITNNPTRSPRAVAQRLREMGFPAITPDRILTSAEAAALWLERSHPGFRYFAVGADWLHQSLAQRGRADETRADFVVVGEGPGLDYNSLTTGINLVLTRGARLVATNPDTSVDACHQGSHLILPGGGALVAPFEAATGKQAVIIGKPEPLLFEMAMERLGFSMGACIMIGDRPDTDIAGAAALGMRTALVRTGRFSPNAPWPKALPRPDWDVAELAALLDVFHEEGIL
jgi:HAD superfamily hydrolase (TIGR01450 family)